MRAHDGTCPAPAGSLDAAKLCIADLVLDLTTQQAFRAGTLLALTATDLRLLTALVKDAGRTLTRAALARQVWQRTSTYGSTIVEVGIWRLRTKVDGPFERKLIHAVRGVGYVCGDLARVGA
jgi:two-component system copper resistance phosphate regulon response regulator CusR